MKGKHELAVVGLLTVLALPTWAADCSLPQFRAIQKQSRAMQRCWNHGNLTCVVNKYYAKDFVYVGNSIIKSKQALYSHYQQSFQSDPKKELPQLTYELVDCKALGKDYISSLGKYTVLDKGTSKEGYDILLWQKVNREYKIITDIPKPIKKG